MRVLFILVICAVSVVVGQSCNNIQCAADQLCCDTNIAGPQCYSSGSYLCLNGDALCPIENGVPDLACGNACYTSDFTCCNGALYGKEASYPCKPSSNDVVYPDFDAELNFEASGESPPFSTYCSYEVTTQSASTYDLYNCSTHSGAYNFNFNESAVLISFPLPSNAGAYSSVELKLYVDNSQGQSQQIAISVFANTLRSSFNATGSISGVSPCDLYRVYNPPLFSFNVTVAAGFKGYQSIDVSNSLIWSLAVNSQTNLQVAVSSLNSCFCVDGYCVAPFGCSCTSPQYQLIVSGKSSSHPPELVFSV